MGTPGRGYESDVSWSRNQGRMQNELPLPSKSNFIYTVIEDMEGENLMQFKMMQVNSIGDKEHPLTKKQQLVKENLANFDGFSIDDVLNKAKKNFNEIKPQQFPREKKIEMQPVLKLVDELLVIKSSEKPLKMAERNRVHSPAVKKKVIMTPKISKKTNMTDKVISNEHHLIAPTVLDRSLMTDDSVHENTPPLSPLHNRKNLNFKNEMILSTPIPFGITKEKEKSDPLFTSYGSAPPSQPSGQFENSIIISDLFDGHDSHDSLPFTEKKLFSPILQSIKTISSPCLSPINPSVAYQQKLDEPDRDNASDSENSNWDRLFHSRHVNNARRRAILKKNSPNPSPEPSPAKIVQNLNRSIRNDMLEQLQQLQNLQSKLQEVTQKYSPSHIQVSPNSHYRSKKLFTRSLEQAFDAVVDETDAALQNPVDQLTQSKFQVDRDVKTDGDIEFLFDSVNSEISPIKSEEKSDSLFLDENWKDLNALYLKSASDQNIGLSDQNLASFIDEKYCVQDLDASLQDCVPLSSFHAHQECVTYTFPRATLSGSKSSIYATPLNNSGLQDSFDSPFESHFNNLSNCTFSNHDSLNNSAQSSLVRLAHKYSAERELKSNRLLNETLDLSFRQNLFDDFNLQQELSFKDRAPILASAYLSKCSLFSSWSAANAAQAYLSRPVE